MNIVRYNEYNDDKQKFFRKHKNDFQCSTSGGSAEYYTKTYVFADGATWCEVMRKVTEMANAEIYRVSIPVEVELFQTEYWNSEDASSKFYYEPWEARR